MTTTFRRLLINPLVANVTTTFLSFGFAFWVYLVTHSVLAASLVSGVSMLIVVLLPFLTAAYRRPTISNDTELVPA
jgi:hypothetical protein